MSRPFDRTVVGAIALVVILTVANMGLAYRNAVRVTGLADDVTHSQEVLSAINQVVTTVKDAERGERGYVITNNDAYRTPFDRADARVPGDLDRLANLIADHPDQAARMPALRDVVNRRVARLRLGMLVMQERGLEDARKLTMADTGRLLMDTITMIAAQMEAEEHRVMAERAVRYEDSRAFALGTTIAGGFIALITVALAAFSLQRHLHARARAESLLFEQKELFRTTLSSIGDAVIATDTAGRVVFINDVATRLTGWSAADAANASLDTVFTIVAEEGGAPMENPATRVLREGTVAATANHAVLVARDGRETPIDDSAAPIRDAEGKVSGAVLVFRDVTERRRAERSLREEDRRKDEFLAILAHELRNPLAPLRNAVELIQQAQYDPAAVTNLRSMMSRQLEQLVRLTDDLLDVARITRNKLQMRKATVSVADVIASALETCEPMLAGSGHRLVQSLPEKTVRVYGDRARLAQVLYNLIGNAAKYTDAGGTIQISLEERDGRAVITVRDTGMGIAPDMLERIFDMFTQADRSVHRAQGGLGIGLTLVKRIVEMHDGTVTARSDGRARGSEFIVSLPALTAEVAEVTRPGLVRPNGDQTTPRLRVLLADDNRDATDTTAQLLRTFGYDVDACYDGESAFTAATKHIPDVMLLDIGMPGLNGYDLARRVRSTDWGANVTLIAVTGWGQTEDRLRSIDAGFDHHLVKPVQLRELTAAIEARRRVQA